MKYLFLLIFLIFSSQICWAIPAYPRKVFVNVNGCSIPIRIYGDEHSKQVEDLDGYTILQNEKEEWVYAALDAGGNLYATSFKLGEKNAEFKSFISSIPRHLKNTVRDQNIRPVVKESNDERPSQPAMGQRRMLIILMEFQDTKFKKSSEDFDQLFNQENYSDDGAEGSVRDYFYRSSYGQLILSCDIYGPFQAANKMSYYGKNSSKGGDDKNPTALFEEAITRVAEEVDLRSYDGNEDGFVDNVHIIYAGYGEEAGGPTNAIWAHEATFYEPYDIQGMKIDRYSCAPELRGNSGIGISHIGPHCHEIGHALGAMDFYDANYNDGGYYLGTGDWDLMASGSWNNDGITPADLNPYVKAFNYGWIEPQILPEGDVILYPSDQDKNSYYIIKNGEEAYLFENRNPSSHDGGLPGKGMLIFHIHPDIENAENEINTSYPQMCYVVCAAANKDIPGESGNDFGEINSDKCPFPGGSSNHLFTNSSTPCAFWWDNSECNITISNIMMSDDGNITLNNGSFIPDVEETIKSEICFEGFEDKEQFTVIYSDQSSWEVIDNYYMRSHFLAYEGDRFLQLLAKSNLINASSAIQFHCPIDNNARRINITGYFNSYGLTKKKSNLIRIGCKSAEEDKWAYHDLDLTVNNIWTPFSVNFEPTGDVDLIIEGYAKAGTAIALDNLKVEQVVATAISASQVHHTAKIIEIYSLSGQKRNQLEKGLNIVRLSDGTVMKVLK